MFPSKNYRSRQNLLYADWNKENTKKIGLEKIQFVMKILLQR